jgi:hypothetical protein
VRAFGYRRTIDRLEAMLLRLQLSGIRDQLDNLLDEAARANLSARETLILLCEREIARCQSGRPCHYI